LGIAEAKSLVGGASRSPASYSLPAIEADPYMVVMRVVVALIVAVLITAAAHTSVPEKGEEK
jgi:hypothetical protein